jgi:hypothetical protein
MSRWETDMLTRRLLGIFVVGSFATAVVVACDDDARNKLIGDLDPTPHEAGADATLDADDEGLLTGDDGALGTDTSAADTATSDVVNDVRPDVRDAGPDVRDTGPDVRDAGPDTLDAADG